MAFIFFIGIFNLFMTFIFCTGAELQLQIILGLQRKLATSHYQGGIKTQEFKRRMLMYRVMDNMYKNFPAYNAIAHIPHNIFDLTSVKMSLVASEYKSSRSVSGRTVTSGIDVIG